MNDELSGTAVLVTGGSGFIGSHLVEALTRRGAHVTNLDIRPAVVAGQAAHWRCGDLRDGDTVMSTVREVKPRVIYNLAAVTDISQGTDALAVNTVGLANLAEAVRRLPTPCLLVHTSTQLVVRPGHHPTHPLDFAPYTEYGESKAQSEILLHEQDHELDWVVVRPTNVWGPRHPTFASQIWRYIDRGWYLHPSGHDPVRSYGYVANVVQQLIRLHSIDRDLVRGQTYYVGDEPMPSSLWLDAFSIALRGRPVRRVPVALLRGAAELGELSARLKGPSPINRGRLFRMSTDYSVPMDKTFSVLGRGPIRLDQGVAATIPWLRSTWGRP